MNIECLPLEIVQLDAEPFPAVAADGSDYGPDSAASPAMAANDSEDASDSESSPAIAANGSDDAPDSEASQVISADGSEDRPDSKASPAVAVVFWEVRVQPCLSPTGEWTSAARTAFANEDRIKNGVR